MKVPQTIFPRRRSMSRVSKLLIAIMAVLCIAPLAHVCDAQVITGTILGNVTDEAKAALPGVSISMRNLDTGETRTAITDLSGKYRAPGLGLGRYEVRAELEGFQTNVRTGISLMVGSEALVNFTLGVAKMTEAIVEIG